MFLPSTVRTPHSNEIIKRITKKLKDTIQFDSGDLGFTRSHQCLRRHASYSLNLCFVTSFFPIYLIILWESLQSLLVKQDLSWERRDSEASFISLQHVKCAYRQKSTQMHESRSNKVKSVITWDFRNQKQTKRGLQREFFDTRNDDTHVLIYSKRRWLWVWL